MLSLSPEDERKRLRGQVLRFRRNEQMRQVHENELVLYISKSNKFNTAWQK